MTIDNYHVHFHLLIHNKKPHQFPMKLKQKNTIKTFSLITSDSLGEIGFFLI